MKPLDMGPRGQILPMLDAAARDESRPAEMREKAAATALIVRARIGGDRLSRTKALLELTRNRTSEDYEEAALSAALAFLNETITACQPLLRSVELRGGKACVRWMSNRGAAYHPKKKKKENKA